MAEPWLMDESEIDKVEYRMRHWSDRREITLAVCRAQHLKTLEWVNQHMFSLIQDGTTFGMQKWESLLAQARKDVKDG